MTVAPATTGSLDVENLTISYRRRGKLLRVVEDVSLRIDSGEAYGLVGESGCGKSTVAMAVMRYLAPNAVIESGSIVFDEPTTGLDATVEAEVLDLVEHLRTQFSSAILFISHNLGIVARLCERVGVLYAGRLIELGPARQVFAEPRHPYTLGLLRCVP